MRYYKYILKYVIVCIYKIVLGVYFCLFFYGRFILEGLGRRWIDEV